MRLGYSKINLCTQRVEWDPALHLLVCACYVGATESSRDDNLDPECARLHGALNCQADSSPVRDAAHNLLGDALAYKRCVEFGLADLLNVQAGPLLRHLLQLCTQLVNALSAAPDDDSRPGRVDSDD